MTDAVALAADGRAAGQARRLVRQCLEAWGVGRAKLEDTACC